MIKTLQQRLALLLLFPVALLLFFTGLLGFIHAKGRLLDEWREAAILKLERAAHHIDMRISQPIDWTEMLNKCPVDPRRGSILGWLLDQLQESEGVAKVKLYWPDKDRERMIVLDSDLRIEKTEMAKLLHAKITEITPPRFDAHTGHKTVSLISNLKDEAGKITGRLEVVLSFDYLMKDILPLGWWQSDMGCLVDETGRYLAHTAVMMKGRVQLGETNDPLELAVLAAMKEKPSGTILEPGFSTDVVAGFYRIEMAPWTIIMYASRDKILAPIVQFSFYYVIAGGLCIVLTLLLIRFVVGKMVRPVRKISQAAEQVASGNYGDPLSVRSVDEIGQLTQSFNKMVEGLKERAFIRNTFGRYMDQEIAKELMRRPEAARLGGEKREVAILISDIRGFTTLSESLSPEATISLLNHYFSRMIEVIQKHQGIIVDFFGDGVLVFFDPLDGPVEPVIRRTVGCALEMQGSMEHFNAEMEEKGLPALQMGVGLNVGEVIVGNIGSETRAKYGIVGSAVNITQRIQSTAKGGDLVISESVYQYLFKDLIIKSSFNVPLKGLQEEVKLYIVEGIAPYMPIV